MVIPKLDLDRINSGIFDKNEGKQAPAVIKGVAVRKLTKYVVKKGDSLWRIAEKVYGNGFLWKKLFKANQDKIKDPNLIYPGQILNK